MLLNILKSGQNIPHIKELPKPQMSIMLRLRNPAPREEVVENWMKL